jgi:hypothetical protein
VARLSEQRSVKKRSRASTENADTAGAEEAAALLWLRTGEQAAPEDVIHSAVARVTELLKQEALGLSPCGQCSRCIAGNGCIRASNRLAATDGKHGARWAEEGSQLVGRWFEV